MSARRNVQTIAAPNAMAQGTPPGHGACCECKAPKPPLNLTCSVDDPSCLDCINIICAGQDNFSRYFVGGHSQGGFLTYSLLMNDPDLIAGAHVTPACANRLMELFRSRDRPTAPILLSRDADFDAADAFLEALSHNRALPTGERTGRPVGGFHGRSLCLALGVQASGRVRFGSCRLSGHRACARL